MGWTAPRFDNSLNGPRWYARPSTPEKARRVRNASYYCRDRSGKERVPASRLRCDGKGGAAKATGAPAAHRLHGQPAALPGSDGGGRGRALLGARDRELGHEVRLIGPQFVRPYVKANKNDASDAEAICEAASRPSMRFVAVKSAAQRDVLAVHRVRQ